MATQTMDQLYCGDAYGAKWNRAWSKYWDRFLLNTPRVADLTVDQIPQDLFDESLARVFWTVVNEVFAGQLPKRVREVCTAPPRPTLSTEEFRARYAAINPSV